MAAQTTFVLSGDQAAARALVDGVIAANGFAPAETMPNGSIKISRGKLTKTMLLGAMAGKDFHMSFLVGYGADAEGRLQVQVGRELGSSALKGGAIGASKASDAYQKLVDDIGAAATQHGVYVGHSAV